MMESVSSSSVHRAARPESSYGGGGKAVQGDTPGFEKYLEQAHHDETAVRDVLSRSFHERMHEAEPGERTRIQRRLEAEGAMNDGRDAGRLLVGPLEKTRTSLQSIETKLPAIEPGGWKDRLALRLDEFQGSQRRLDSFLSQCESGRQFSQQEILGVQLEAHRLAQSVELVSKTVEHAVSGMKTIFQTNV